MNRTWHLLIASLLTMAMAAAGCSDDRGSDSSASSDFLVMLEHLPAGAHSVVYTDIAALQALTAKADVSSVTFLHRYEAVGIAIDFDGVDYITTIVYNHSSDDTAADNAVRLDQILQTEDSFVTGQPWSDTYKVQSIGAAGTLVTVELTVLAHPTEPILARLRQDTLFAEEPAE